MTRERVLIVSPHPLFRDGIIHLLGDQAQIVGAVARWEEVAALSLAEPPQVIIVDHDDAKLKETDLAPLLWPDADDLRVIYVTLAGERMTVHDRRQKIGAGEADLLQALKGERWQAPPAAKTFVTGPDQPVSDRDNTQRRRSHMERSRNGRHFLIVSVLVVISTVLVALLLFNSRLAPVAASTQAGPVDTLMAVQLGIISFLFSLIVVFMLYSLVVFRRKAGDDSDGAHFHGNTKLEIVWTILPLITVVGLAIAGARGLSQVTAAAPNEMVVEVIGQQYAFQFSYPEQQIINQSELWLPVDQPVLFKITSRDVIHDFWVPEFRVKQDGVPGIISELRVTPNKIGQYKVRCDELCGILHHAMESPVNVVSRSEFDAWVAGKQAEASGVVLSEAAKRGMEISNSNGCTACHSVNGNPGAGPTWKGLYGVERELADGSKVLADADYLAKAIINPNAQIPAGFNANIMPGIYRDQLSDEQINDIIEYIKALAE